MIENIFCFVLMTTGVVLAFIYSPYFILLFILGVLLRVHFYRIENKRYVVRGYYIDDEHDQSIYYVVKNAKLKRDE